MSDDLSLFDERLRRSAVISLVSGMLLGFLAVMGQRMQTSVETPWGMGVVFGLLAAAALYGVSYRNHSRRLE